MAKTIEAVYAGGVFTPLQGIALPEGERVTLSVEPARSSPSPDEMLNLLGQVYEGLSEQEIQEIEEIVLDRSNFFGDRSNPIEL
jgi:predicted DNA-binding antitoxin AbrB/MazE fold protein